MKFKCGKLQLANSLTNVQKAVAQRENVPAMDYVTRFDKESGMITKVYADGRVEYVLN